MYFTVHQHSNGEWSWTLRAGDDEAVIAKREGFTTRGHCIHSIELVKSVTDTTPVKEE